MIGDYMTPHLEEAYVELKTHNRNFFKTGKAITASAGKNLIAPLMKFDTDTILVSVSFYY